jgi:hypothetical protein
MTLGLSIKRKGLDLPLELTACYNLGKLRLISCIFAVVNTFAELCVSIALDYSPITLRTSRKAKKLQLASKQFFAIRNADLDKPKQHFELIRKTRHWK